MKLLILTNGDYGNYHFCKAQSEYDYVICADNGMKHARFLNILPNEIVGDFDSCQEEDLKYFKEQGVPILKVPSEKDETDTELALTMAIDKGASCIHIYGGMGSRIDHTLANIHLLYLGYQHNIEIVLFSGHNEVRLIKDFVKLKGEVGQIVSLLPFSDEVKGVTTKSLAYPLEKGTFQKSKPYGVSNVMTAGEAEVSIEEGLLLVIKAND